MKIAQNEFVTILNALKRQQERDRDMGRKIAQMGDGSFVYTTPLVDDTTKFLDNILCPNEELIEYFCWEKDFGSKNAEDCIRHNDGTTYSLRTAEELYKYIFKFCNN